jgi:hypothetical protein
VRGTWADFVIEEEIGRGSFGSVYRAHHPTLRQPIALKLIPVVEGNAREIERALDESRRLASVRHHNVVTVHDARYADGHVGICMELIAGESLSEVVARRGRMGPDEVLACAATLCRAVSAIHGAQVLHNDIKAHNVVREDGGRLVLMDFGAGRRLAEPDRTTGLYLVGTPVYMAPEILRFQEPSAASDIYSLGVLLFYLLTQAYPVDGGSMEEIARAHGRGDRRFLGDLRSDLPERLLAVVDRALEPDPTDRYRSCGEMLHDLTAGQRVRTRELDADAGARGHAPRGPLPADPGAPVMAPRDSLAGAAPFVILMVPGVWIIGFLSSRAHRLMFGVRDPYDLAGPLDWLIAGLRTLPLPLFSMLLALTAYVFVAFVWRLTTRVSVTASTWSKATSRRLVTASGRVGLDDPMMAGSLILLTQSAVLVAVYWSFSGLVTAITSPLVNGPVAAHARLDPAREWEGWLPFCMAASVLTLAGGAAWSWLARRRRPGEGGLGVITAGVALTAVSLAMATVPWQVVYQSDLTVARFGSERCYVVEGRVSDTVLLLCPWRTAGRSVIVPKDDPDLTIHEGSQNVYSAVAESLPTDGGT